ncbi:hypothetical protein IPM62_00100 [Candidatus Woesebacteria bacterium]|nr:MAG: hypothetical protein IPM62_00100 [Candidatus Woesebacteria bacterium]
MLDDNKKTINTAKVDDSSSNSLDPETKTDDGKDAKILDTQTNDPFVTSASNFVNTDTASVKSPPKTIATILGIVLLVAGVAAGVYLVNQQTKVTTKAWDCKNYVFEVSQDGVVITRNGSTRNEPLQKAEVKINGSLIATLDVPALNAGDAATLGNVPVPSDAFTWEVIGTKDCENSGSYGSEDPSPTTPESKVSAQCNLVSVYDSSWNKLSNAELTKLKAGVKVRFAVSGSTNSGSIEKARFTVNGALKPETNVKKPGTEEFYYEYQIPEDTANFSVKAELFHSELGWF